MPAKISPIIVEKKINVMNEHICFLIGFVVEHYMEYALSVSLLGLLLSLGHLMMILFCFSLLLFSLFGISSFDELSSVLVLWVLCLLFLYCGN